VSGYLWLKVTELLSTNATYDISEAQTCSVRRFVTNFAHLDCQKTVVQSGCTASILLNCTLIVNTDTPIVSLSGHIVAYNCNKRTITHCYVI
jgi:hypothetical protein